MTREALEKLENEIVKLVGGREQLGYFDANSETILALGVALLGVVKHLKEKEPPTQKKKK